MKGEVSCSAYFLQNLSALDELQHLFKINIYAILHLFKINICTILHLFKINIATKIYFLSDFTKYYGDKNTIFFCSDISLYFVCYFLIFPNIMLAHR